MRLTWVRILWRCYRKMALQSGIEGFVVALSNLYEMVLFLLSVLNPIGNGMKTIVL
jgi:hypothetical protein